MTPIETSDAPAVERGKAPAVAFGEFEFDPAALILTRAGAEISLPPRVLGVLHLLLARAGEIVPRQEIIDSVWKEAFVTDTSLAEAVSFLRQALGDDPQSPTYVQTIHRRGYRFVAPVVRRAELAAPVATAVPLRPPGDADSRRVLPSIGGVLVPWSVAALAAALAFAAVWQLTHRDAARAPIARFPLSPPAGASFDPRGAALALSPDGLRVAFSACQTTGCMLYARGLDRLESQPLAGTAGATAPFFSPDGTWVGFFAEGKLKKVALAGGSPLILADVPEARGGTWTTDGRIIFGGSTVSGLMWIPEQGGDAATLTTPRQNDGEVRHSWPAVMPGGRALLFTIAESISPRAPGRIGVLPFDRAGVSPNWTTLPGASGMARAISPDAIVFSRGTELQAMSFDPVRRSIAGVPQTVVPAVASGSAAQFAVSEAGSLIYAEPAATDDPDPVFWWSPDKTTPISRAAVPLASPALSPDGTRLAAAGEGDGTRPDIWVVEIARGAATRITHGGISASPVWSADGRTVYFATRISGAFEVWSADADGGRPATRLIASGEHAFPVAASPDGALLAVVRPGASTRADLWSLPLRGGAPAPLVQTPYDDVAAAFSPDGRLVAYQSNEAGRWDVYVQRLSDGRRTVVSSGGGVRPFWSRDGSALYYGAGNRLMSATISAREALHISAPVAVVALDSAAPLGVAPDGRFLFERLPPSASDRAILALEWLRELRQLLGPPSARLPR